MYEKFDAALSRALSPDDTPFGAGDRTLAIATARRAASDNRIKAMNEARLGEFRFAKIHEAASIRYHEDAEAMQRSGQPLHQSVVYYLETARRYQRLEGPRPTQHDAATPTAKTSGKVLAYRQ